MKTAEYDFFLPKELIALRPVPKRDRSRLLVLHRNGKIEHRRFYELPSFLNAGDMVIINNSKVFPASLIGHKSTGGKLKILLVNESSPGKWNILTRENYTGTVKISENLTARIDDGKTACFEHPAFLRPLIWKEGQMPLPPYIKRQPDKTDKERYQTVYAKVEGSIAAPTAGLHFTEDLLENLKARSVAIRSITLHIGIGTFKPVRSSHVEDHKMDEEFFEINSNILSEIAEAKKAGKRIFAVGTTTTRALEGFLSGSARTSSINGCIYGSTDIFIHEGYKFKTVDCLITNFHLPRSTPLILTATIAGRKKLLNAYKSATSRRYRFFSYGDAMLVL
jgi:S-adenosylmethionine:tRNA ribosyltransferase-isomerase